MALVRTTPLLLLLSLLFIATEAKLIGSGASTLQKVFGDLIPKLNAAKKVNIFYNATGSGIGRAQFIKKSVQFACSDIPFTNLEEVKIKEIKHTITYSLETISIFVNIPGYTGALKLTSDLIALIFSGQITKWVDSRIVALNPKLKVSSSQVIFVVHRKDSSGTTAIFTKWLNKRKAWKLGEGGTIKWPTKNFIGADGSARVGAAMSGKPFSIGYLGTGIGYALNLGLNEVYIKSIAGKFLRASKSDVYASIPNPLPSSTSPWISIASLLLDHSGPSSYPIVTFTYVFARKNAVPLGVTGGLLKAFLNYLMSTAGQDFAARNYFNRLPQKIVRSNVAAVKTIVLAKGVKIPF